MDPPQPITKTPPTPEPAKWPTERKGGEGTLPPIGTDEVPIKDVILETPGGVMIQPNPIYPSSCQGKGVEGYAKVQFDVTASGQVVNARVVDSSHSCFNRTAIQTIQKWKYQPRGSGGSEIIQRGVTKTFRFRLTE